MDAHLAQLCTQSMSAAIAARSTLRRQQHALPAIVGAALVAAAVLACAAPASASQGPEDTCSSWCCLNTCNKDGHEGILCNACLAACYKNGGCYQGDCLSYCCVSACLPPSGSLNSTICNSCYQRCLQNQGCMET